MCSDCRDSSHIQCGCYGTCDGCGKDVDRGEDGWPCHECDKWYCYGCRHENNSCVECNPPEEDEDQSQDDKQEQDDKQHDAQ